jgi:hypothetical protein
MSPDELASFQLVEWHPIPPRAGERRARGRYSRQQRFMSVSRSGSPQVVCLRATEPAAARQIEILQISSARVSKLSTALRNRQPRDRLLDEHRFRSLGKLVVSNLNRIADVHNVGN